MKKLKFIYSLACGFAMLSIVLSVPVTLQAEPAQPKGANSELDNWKARALKAEEELARRPAGGEKTNVKLPRPAPANLDAKTTALLVLDLSNRCNDPAQVCGQLVPRIKEFLPKTRAAKVFTIYTVSASAKDTPQGKVWDNFGALPDEPVIAPDSIDKFWTGELGPMLQKRGIKTVIVTGASTNNAVLFTAASAARMLGFNVVIPMDGVIAKNSYESEYPIYQLTVMPSGADKRFSFTTLEGISFK